ncbi:MAG TPA: DUF5348 domain-containing protein [Ktedonobacteraceae bacterium]|jgi:hypothetical protein
MQKHATTEMTMTLEKKALLRYDLEARRYRLGSEVFHAGDSMEIEVAPDIWLPVRIQSDLLYSEEGWIFTTPTGIDILPKEGLAVRHHMNHGSFF